MCMAAGGGFSPFFVSDWRGLIFRLKWSKSKKLSFDVPLLAAETKEKIEKHKEGKRSSVGDPDYGERVAY